MRVRTSTYDEDLGVFTLRSETDTTDTTVIFPAPGRPIEAVSVDSIGVRHLDSSHSVIYPSQRVDSEDTFIVIATKSPWPIPPSAQVSPPLTHAEASNLLDTARLAYDPYIELRAKLRFTPDTGQ